MRSVRYVVASSVDGYIAGPAGEPDWIIGDPEIDFGALFARFDTFLMGRKTYEAMAAHGEDQRASTYVFSRTLRQEDHPFVTIVSGDVADRVREIRGRPGKDIWLFGGGSLFRSLLDLGLVDAVEITVIPVLLGGGLPLLASPASRATLTLEGHRVYGTGIVTLEYGVRAPWGVGRHGA
jgi:dihydrofolate reductase